MDSLGEEFAIDYIVIDFCKAFELVHDRLITNLAASGVDLSAVVWVIIIITIIIIYLFTAIVLLTGGSGYFTCTQTMKLVSTKFNPGGLHEKHVVATWNRITCRSTRCHSLYYFTIYCSTCFEC